MTLTHASHYCLFDKLAKLGVKALVLFKVKGARVGGDGSEELNSPRTSFVFRHNGRGFFVKFITVQVIQGLHVILSLAHPALLKVFHYVQGCWAFHSGVAIMPRLSWTGGTGHT